MKRYVGIILIALLSSVALLSQVRADETSLITPNTVEQPGTFRLLRYDEDYHYFKNPENRHGALDDIKYISFNKDRSIYLSLGGEFREQYEFFNKQNWGLLPYPNKHLLSRIMEDADFHLDENIRIFLELKSGFISWNSYPPDPVSVDDFDLNQFFIDRKWNLAKERNLTLRLGMQELDYGAERLIAVREGPNVRQGFDGVKTILNLGKSRLDMFWVLPVNTYPGVFDDHPSVTEQLWSAYLVSSFSSFKLNLYYIGFRQDDAVFAAGAGNELRHSVGMRVFKDPEENVNSFDFDTEGVYQFGSFADQSISAWTLTANPGYTLVHLPLSPHFGLRASIISGDQNQGKGSLGTFNPLFPRGNYFDFANEIGPADLISVNPYINLNVSSSISFTLGYNALWRESAEDGIYSPALIILRGPNGSRARFISSEAAFTSSYQVSKNINLIAGYTYFSAGNFITETGPADASHYASLYAYFIY